jgi:hexosaminidase
VTLLDWHYDPAESYPSVQVLAQAGRRFWVCPGTGSWNSLFPRLNGARINIRNLVCDGASAASATGDGSVPGECEGALLTDWGDFGHYQHLGLSWHGYLLGAAQGWTGGMTADGEFDDAFGALFFGPHHETILEALRRLVRTNDLPGIYGPNRSHTILALFDEPLLGRMVEGDEALPADTLREMQLLAESAAAACDRLAAGHPRERTLREMASAARLTGCAARKTALAQAIRATLRELAALGEQAGAAEQRLHDQCLALEFLAAELEDLRAEWETLWLARARRSEIHIALGLFAGLRVRLELAAAWLEAQRQAFLQGRPVDADLTTYEAGHYRVLWQA